MGENRVYVEWGYFGLCGWRLFREHHKAAGFSCLGYTVQRMIGDDSSGSEYGKPGATLAEFTIDVNHMDSYDSSFASLFVVLCYLSY